MAKPQPVLSSCPSRLPARSCTRFYFQVLACCWFWFDAALVFYCSLGANGRKMASPFSWFLGLLRYMPPHVLRAQTSVQHMCHRQHFSNVCIIEPVKKYPSCTVYIKVNRRKRIYLIYRQNGKHGRLLSYKQANGGGEEAVQRDAQKIPQLLFKSAILF